MCCIWKTGYFKYLTSKIIIDVKFYLYYIDRFTTVTTQKYFITNSDGLLI